MQANPTVRTGHCLYTLRKKLFSSVWRWHIREMAAHGHKHTVLCLSSSLRSPEFESLQAFCGRHVGFVTERVTVLRVHALFKHAVCRKFARYRRNRTKN